MKNSCEISETKTAERSERAKKLYRYVTEVARRIDEATASCRTISDHFSTHIEVQRQKLKDNCEKLFFLDPLNYGKKSLELLWRKVYYDTVSAAKKLRESENDYDSFLFTHIMCGVGHFHHFITRLQSEMKIQFNEMDYSSLHNDDTSEELLVTTEDELEFGKTALHSCLIYLGDLSRYQTEIFHNFDPSTAARYYLQAAHIDLSSGMPYNQLGNLYLDKNYNLDSICYYIHCLNCAIPFEGALGNLTKLFEKSAQFYETQNAPESITQTEHIQSTISNFLALIEIWYLNKNDTNIPQRCNAIAHQLKIALEFNKPVFPDIKDYNDYVQAVEEENINPSYLNGNLIHKMVQICIFTIAKITEVDEQKAFACKAFTLAFLSQLLQKLLKQLEMFGLKNPSQKYQPRSIIKADINSKEAKDELKQTVEPPVPITNGNEETVNGIYQKASDEDNKKLLNGDVKNNKKSLTKRRRRRRIASSESSDVSDAETESSEVGSDESCSDEDLSDSSYQTDDESVTENSLYNGSDTEEKNKTINGANEELPIINKGNDINSNGEAKSIHNVKDLLDKSNCNETNNELNTQELHNFLFGDNFLPSIKLLQDWVLTEKDLILSCGDSGEPLFQCVVDLLNIFTFYFSPKSNETVSKENEKVLNYARRIAKHLKLEYKTIPLPEDINLRGTNICKYDKDAAEWQISEKFKPSVFKENVIRILNFIDFGNQIAKIVNRIRFNRTMKIFYLKKVPLPKLNTKINHKRSREWHNSKKPHVETTEGGLLRQLGKLWLASQVRELERSGQSATPAFLALDAAALHKHLRRIKQLLHTRNFILLIPTIVLQELDDLKREKSTARDAIRWLEVQLKSGSRFVRAQRPGQSRPLPLLKYPRKAPPFVHNFVQILEFCNHFIGEEKNQGGNGDSENILHGKSVPLLILLVGDEPGGSDEQQYKEFSLTGTAQAAGISVEYIADFYAKWRQTAHKSGKKR